MSKHTPTPWHARALKNPIGGCTHEVCWSDDGECVAENVYGEENAAFIVRAVNSHDELVEALEYLICLTDRTALAAPQAIEQGRKALAKAKEGQT